MQRMRSVYTVLCCLGWAACADVGGDPDTSAGALSPLFQRGEREPAEQAPNEADLPYLVDPRTGRIVRELPPAVLTDILAQLKRKGMTREVDNMQRLYDRASGRVRDPSRIEKAEARLRALGLQKEARHAAQD